MERPHQTVEAGAAVNLRLTLDFFNQPLLSSLVRSRSRHVSPWIISTDTYPVGKLGHAASPGSLRSHVSDLASINRSLFFCWSKLTLKVAHGEASSRLRLSKTRVTPSIPFFLSIYFPPFTFVFLLSSLPLLPQLCQQTGLCWSIYLRVGVSSVAR